MQMQINGDVLAWYAAITSTAGLSVSVIQHIRNRCEPIAHVQKDMVHVGNGQDSTTRWLTTTISNRGVRPVTVTQIAIHDRIAKTMIIMNDSLVPHSLDDGNARSYRIEQAGLKLENIDKIVVLDATGIFWHGKFRVGPAIKLKPSSSFVPK